MPKYEENPPVLKVNPGNILGFDYGTHSIGMAVGQTITGTARTLPALRVTSRTIPWNLLEKVLEEWRPTALVVGIPYNMDDTEQWSTQAARDFAHELLSRFSMSVYGIDERLTTREARSLLFERKGYSALEKTGVDSMAATLILERFLQKL